MRVLKITLLFVVISAIGAGVYFWMQAPPPDTTDPPAAENEFILKVEQKIGELKVKPHRMFCKDFYNEVAYLINEFYKQNRFGDDQLENDQRKENLEKELYSVYANKFVKQAYYVLRRSDWKSEDLKFIQSERDALAKSDFLVSGSSVAGYLTEIQTILNKYYEISEFISSSKSFSYSGNSLSDHFPIDDAQKIIKKASAYKKNRMDNEYVYNCFRLHDGLNEVPATLFKKHVLYLDNKIIYWSNMWCKYASQTDYEVNLYTPIKAEIDDLDNNSGVYEDEDNLNDEYSRLLDKWSKDINRAYKATYPCN